MYTYTDDVEDFTDLSMHFTVHSDPKCLGVYAEGYGSTCSSEGFRLPLLLSLYFVLHSNCGVNALFVSLCVTCINSNLNKRGGQNKFPGFSFIYMCVFVVLCISVVETTKQVGNEWNEVCPQPSVSQHALSQHSWVFSWCESGLESHDILIHHHGYTSEAPCD